MRTTSSKYTLTKIADFINKFRQFVPVAREVNPDVEPYLSIVAARAMSLRPDARYESVQEFARALERPAGRPIQISEGRRTPGLYLVVPAGPEEHGDPAGRKLQGRRGGRNHEELVFIVDVRGRLAGIRRHDDGIRPRDSGGRPRIHLR